MSSAPWMILFSALAAIAVGALLLLVSAQVEGVGAPGALAVVGGIGLLVHWVRGRSRWGQVDPGAAVRPLSPAEEAQLATKKRGVRLILLLGVVVMVVVGVVQGVSGRVYNRGTHRSIDDPAGAWFVGGSMIVLGVGVMIGVAISALRSGGPRPPSAGAGEEAGPWG